MVSARRGWGTQRANPGALQRNVFVRPPSGEPAPSGPPLGALFRGATSARRGSGPQGANPGPSGIALLFVCAQGIQHPVGHRWAPEAPCGKRMVGQAREGTSDKTGVGRTKDDGAVKVQQITRDTMRSRARGPHAHGNTERQIVGGLSTEVCGQQKQSNDPHNNQHSPSTPSTGRR